MVLTKKISLRTLIAILLSLSLGIFLIDLQTPLGVADGFCYLIVLLLSLWSNNKKITITLVFITIVLTIVGYFLSPSATPNSQSFIAITNRLVSILALIICGFFIIQFKSMQEEVIAKKTELEELTALLKKSNFELETRVKERTMALEDSLENLRNSKLELQKALQQEKELSELKSRFVSMASHEFRTPLATILSSLSLVSTYSKQNEKEKIIKHINRIKSSVVHLTDLLTDILSITKLEEGKINVSFEKFRIKDFATEIIFETQGITKENQNIDYNHNGHEEVVLDKKILRNIMLNLISNAIKFSKEDIKVSSEFNGVVFSLTVQDKGIGIPIEDQKYLFERFYRGNNASEIQGTGLGLNIVRHYVKLLSGTINFVSNVGEGSIFTVKCQLDPDKAILYNHSFSEVL